MDQNNKNGNNINLGETPNGSSSGVEFQESGWSAVKYYREQDTPKIIRWTMKCSGGYIKDKKQASYLLFVFVVIMIIVSFFLIFSSGEKAEIKAPPGEKVIYPQNEPPRLQ